MAVLVLPLSYGLEPVALLLLVAAATALLALLVYTRTNAYPFPPGPPAEPILGHLRKLPLHDRGRVYAQMGEELHTDLIGLRLGPTQPVVIINSVEAATELLDKQGKINSDRPRFWYGELMGYIHTLSFMPWGPRMQVHRKVIQRELAKAAIMKYGAMQTAECRLLIPRLVGSQKMQEIQIRRAATSIILGIAFGHTIESDDDPYIQIAVDASRGLGAVGGTGTSLVDIVPLSRYLPNFIAPAGLRWARAHKEAARRIHEIPCHDLQQKMAAGTARPSLLMALLEDVARKEGKSPLTVQDAQGAAVTMYAAGQDTTTSAIMTFLVNMLLHPDVQARAQAELDAVIGTERLPEYEDRPNLPYLEHVMWEVFRWFPPTPIGLAHKSLQAQTFRGYYFPKGTILIPNAYAMTHDKNVYSDPTRFDPDRYARGEPAPAGQWGFGRRVCPGQHLASATVWICMATTLASIKLLPALSSEGKEEPPSMNISIGFQTRIDDFKCRIEYRSKEAEQLIAHATDRA